MDKNRDLFVCDSAKGTVRSTQGAFITVGGFTRGAIVTDQFNIIGVSCIAERDYRHSAELSGYIYVYDARWQLLKKMELKEQGQILDIRSPGSRDYCFPNIIGRTPNIVNRPEGMSPCKSKIYNLMCKNRPSYQWWQDHGHEWPDEMEKRYTTTPLYNIQELMVSTYMAHSAPARVLEFGCGTGRFLRHLRHIDGLEVFGYDQSVSMVRGMRA